MKQINSIEELSEGQEVYIKVKSESFENKRYPIKLIYTDSENFILINKDFLYNVESKNSKVNLFTAEPVGNSEKLVLPEIGKEYEFSYEGSIWWKEKVIGIDLENRKITENIFIRPIQQSEEEIKAIELLKSLGYDVNKK